MLQKLNILDVGGGAGLILKIIANEIENKYGVKVNKYLLDLSPLALEIQKKTNPDWKKALNENICNTSLQTKEIDLTLMIDVLEHIPDPILALKEIRRVSKFMILKVPLEYNLYYNIGDLLKKGKFRRQQIETYGHINVYDFSELKSQIEKYAGKVSSYEFTNAHQYRLSKNNMGLRSKAINSIASHLYRLSPTLCSRIFFDHVIALLECY